jgi:hypothetical protein
MCNICASLNILVSTEQWISIFCHLAVTLTSNLMDDSPLSVFLLSALNTCRPGI